MSALELENLTKSFDSIRAVDRLWIEFEEGRITALVGPNGAGKTTVFNLICGYLSSDEGTIIYRGRNIVGLPPWRIAQMGMGRLFQDVRMFKRMTVKDNIIVAFNRQKESAFLSVFARWKVMQKERAMSEQATKLLEFVGLADKADELAENLSYGQQKLLAIARLLAADPDILLLDEPTAGISPQMVQSILQVIQKLAQLGKTILVIEHNMNVVFEVAHWVYFMDEGQVVSFGLPAEVLGDPEVRAVYVGL